MLHRFRDRFGTAGLAVAIVALVAALGGTALAAGSLTGKEKKEVKKIAKKYAGKRGPRGKNGQNGINGVNGAPGIPGADGTNGADGSNGSNGSDGADGSSVKSKSLTIGNEHCIAGGSEFTASNGATYACNGEEGAEGPPGEDGEDGNPWAVGGVLPAGEAETGSWAVGQMGTTRGPEEEELETSGIVGSAISFTIPLASGGVPVTYVPEESEEAHPQCPGTAAEPKAAPGNLCVYTASGFESEFVVETNPETNESASGAGKAGVILRFYLSSGSASSYGSWIVRAPES